MNKKKILIVLIGACLLLSLSICSGCGSVPRIDIKLIEPEPIPAAYLESPSGCDWDGDNTYQGMINQIERLQQCLEKSRLHLKQITEWEAGQIDIIKKKKLELGIE